jgi:hypothetical protein
MQAILFTKRMSLAVLAGGILCWGIYFGDQHRDKVLGFERDYLGIKPSVSAIKLRTSASRPVSVSQPGSELLAPPVKSPEAPRPIEANQPALQPTSQTAIGSPNNVPARTEPAVTSIGVDAVSASPQGSLMIPIAVRVKILMDDRYANANPDWISYAQRTISAAAQTYRLNFGIDLRLAGVVQWPETLEGLDLDAMYQRLRRCPREGADVLLGFVADRLSANTYAKGNPIADGPFNGAHALVGITPGSDPAHLRGVLRGIGHLLGAVEIADPNSEPYRLGSWMSDAPIMAERTPWIDLDNRQRILLHKSRPFLPEQKNEEKP